VLLIITAPIAVIAIMALIAAIVITAFILLMAVTALTALIVLISQQYVFINVFAIQVNILMKISRYVLIVATNVRHALIVQYA
jgi:hypothetical protein